MEQSPTSMDHVGTRLIAPGIVLVLALLSLLHLLVPPLGRAQGNVQTIPHGGDAVARYRPRVVVSSDFPPLDVIPGGLGHGPPEKRSDPDDLQSFVRFLVYANEFRIEALIATAGTLANVANKQHMLDMLAIYDAVDDALRAHDAAFPTAAELQARVYQGLSGTWGKPARQILGEGKDSEASRRIIEIVDASDEPIWYLFWGGTRELAQALWRVRQERSPEQVTRFVAKIHVYMIAHQDGTGAWIEENFPDLFVITSLKAFHGMFSGGAAELANEAWLNENVRQGHGPLGAAYPPAGWSGKPGMQEGDTPSFLYLLSGTRGLAALEDPTLGGWGGRFVPRAPGSRHFVDAPEGAEAVYRWRDAAQRDFAARMDLCVRPPGQVNHAPTAVIDGDRSAQILRRELAAGGAVTLDAAGSRDPDGGPLSFRWWVYRERGTYAGDLALEGADGPRPRVRAPAVDAPHTAHLILEVTDAGDPPLTSYRRVILQLGPTAGR